MPRINLEPPRHKSEEEIVKLATNQNLLLLLASLVCATTAATYHWSPYDYQWQVANVEDNDIPPKRSQIGNTKSPKFVHGPGYLSEGCSFQGYPTWQVALAYLARRLTRDICDARDKRDVTYVT